jgi:cysteine desulfurase/selenocysteine lyase
VNRIYLDNAATSFPKPPEVWSTFRHVAEGLGAPYGRSGYDEAVATGQVVERARARLARFFGARPEHVVFTLNATDALNLAIKGRLREGDHAITTALEHNSVMRPLMSLHAERRIRLTVIPASSTSGIDPDDVRRAIAPETRLVVLLHASNVCGTLLPIRDVGRICRERGVPFLVDAAQTAGSRAISLETDFIDLLAVPGHKGLLGPPGTGALVLREDIGLKPWREGGTGSRSAEPSQPEELPARLEAGSANAPGIAALAAGIEHLEQLGMENVERRLAEVGGRLGRGLEEIGGLTWHAPRPGGPGEPIYSVRLAGYEVDELALALDAVFGIKTRSGLHCAPGVHRLLGTFPQGTCRLSPGIFTSNEEIDAALAALRELASGRRRD